MCIIFKNISEFPPSSMRKHICFSMKVYFDPRSQILDPRFQVLFVLLGTINHDLLLKDVIVTLYKIKNLNHKYLKQILIISIENYLY